MGIFLKGLQKAQQCEIDSFFLGNSLTKIREYYGLFKNISETYSIDNEEFARLFGRHQEIFKCFDTDNNLLIDGLQLFSGLIVLSRNISFHDKVSFLFQLFDFNDLRSLSKTDLEFLFISATNAVIKIYQLKNIHDDSHIQDFVKEAFPNEDRINISQILKWAQDSPIVTTFFQIIHQRPTSASILPRKIYFTLQDKEDAPSSYHYANQQKFMLDTQKLIRFPQEYNQFDMKNYDINPTAKWVYGIRYQDVKQFIEYVKQGGEELIIYFVGKVAVIYNTQSHQQRHYLAHRHQIISLTAHEGLCASGQYAKVPEIRVWNYITLETVQVLKGNHIKGVHLIRFIDSQLLVSCGCLQQSPIIIFSIESGQSIFSTYCNSPAVEISLLVNFTNRTAQEFIVCSLYELYHFQSTNTPQGKAITLKKLSLEENNGSSQREGKITTCCFFMINSHFKHLRQYDERVEKYVMTGHDNGAINVWNLAKREKEYLFSQESNEIVRLIPTHNYLLVLTNSSFISYYSINLSQKQRLRLIDITQTDDQLNSYDLCECLLNKQEHKLLIVTQKADLFFLKEQECESLPSLSHFSNRKYKTHKVEHIFPIGGRIKMHKLLKKDHSQNLYLAIDHTIKAIDVEKHIFMREWNIGQQIVSFDVIHNKSHGLFIVAATNQNLIYSFSNTQQSINRAKVDYQIVSVMAHVEEPSSTIIVVVSTKENIVKYNMIRNNFTNPYTVTRPNLCAQFSELQGSKIMLSGQNNQLSALIVKEMHIQALANTNYRTTAFLLKLYYHIPMASSKLRLPVLVGYQAKALVAGRQDGKIYFWNGYEQLSNRNFVVLDVHTSCIADLAFTHNQKYMYSCGVEDGLIVQWRFAYFNQYGSATICRLREESTNQPTQDEVSQRRVAFCRFRNDKLAKNYDQHISIKGIKNDVIRRLFKSNISQWKIPNKSMRLQQPNLHLKMDFVFGIQTYNQNNNVISLSKPKRFLYFISKIVVIYHPLENGQQFYRGHQFKVTCLALLEDKVRVASAQAAYRPSIHIWSTATLQTLRIIPTQHRWGIIQLATHRNIILSFGFKEINYQEETGNNQSEQATERTMYLYQVVDYEKGLFIAGREEKDLVHSMAINPKDTLSFAACTEGKVVFWQVRFNSIIKKKICWIGGDTPTCCVYYSPSKGDPDLLVGTASGNLGMIARRQYWNIFKRGEKNAKRINCILVVKREGESLIVVASEDNHLRIYNQHLQERLKESMLKIQPTEQGSKKVRESKGDRENRNCSVQSLSLVQGQGKQELCILIGTRNGQIMQLIQSRQNRHTKGINFKAILFLRFNLSQDTKRVRNKVLMAHHPKLQIVVTIGQDQQIIFWDTQHNKLLHVTELPTENEKKYPTAIKFSQSGDHLIIGFSDGELMFLESKMSKTIQAKTDEKYCPLNLGKAKREKDEDGQAVLNIELSENGEYIAVSYQKIVGDRSYSCIKISHFKIKDRPKTNKSQYQKILENTSILPCPHLDKSFHTQSGLLFGFAAYSMSFVMSETTNKHYFLSYYQMVDENQNRLSISMEKGQERNYNIWEVSDSIYPVTSPLIQSIKWKHFFIHNAIQTNYIFHQTSLTLGKQQEQAPSNNNLDLTEFTNMVILHKCVVASSFNGDLHIFKLATLQGEDYGMIGTTIPAHSCKINQVELFHHQLRNTLYTTGQNDECVIKWVAQKFQTVTDYEEHTDQDRDIFGEVPDKQELTLKLELYKRKAEVERVVLRNYDFIDWFKVRDILGRRAEQVRNNLKYDKYNRMIYSSGHSVVMVQGESSNKEFLYLKEDATHCLQQITLIEISKDGQLLISCHGGIKSGILIWQLNSKILLKKFYFKEIVHILYVVISDDNLRMVVYGLGVELVAQIIMIDLQNEQIMGVVTYANKKPWQIKGLCFRPHSHDTFFTCGVENIKEWRIISSQIVNTMSYQNEEKVINTCIDFIGDSLVVVNDKGELVIWCESGEIIKKEQHQNMINCLAVSNNGYIATGSISSQGSQAQVIIWSFISQQLTILDKITIRHQSMPSPILSTKLQGKKAKYVDVQSLCISKDNKKNKVLIGVSKGDIYEYYFEPIVKKEKGEMKSSLAIESKASLVASYEDQESIKSMFFSTDESRLFEISRSGLLRIWRVSKAELEWAHHFQTPTVAMVYATKYDLLIIAFRQCIRFFKYKQHQVKPLMEIQQNYKQFRCITHLVIGPNDKFIVLGIDRNSDRANIIQLYQITDSDFNFISTHQVGSPISFIDFNKMTTNDKAYMLVNTEKSAQLFDLIGPVNLTDQLIPNIEWIGNGVQLSKKAIKAKGEHLERFKDGLIVNIIEIGGKFIVFDCYAGIYLYKDEQLVANCHLNISSIDAVAISSTQKWIAVGSKVDRNILLIELSQLIHQK